MSPFLTSTPRDMPSYATIDYLPDLTTTEMQSAQRLTFSPYSTTSPGISWDNHASYSTNASYAILHSTFVWSARAGATYDISSYSYFDPYLIQVYDNLGNVVAVDTEMYIDTYGYDYVWDFVAPYSGDYFVSAGWRQGTASSNKFVWLAIYEDVGTATATPIPSLAAAADTASATESGGANNGTLGVNGTGNVLTNDAGTSISVISVQAGSVINSGATSVISGSTSAAAGAAVAGTYGTLSIAANGEFIYTVDNGKASVQFLSVGDSYTDTFTYQIKNSSNQTATARVTVTVNGANDAPTPAVMENQLVRIGVSGSTYTSFSVPNFDDPDTSSFALSYSASMSGGASLPSWLTFNPVTRSFVGTATTTNVGSYDLRVAATDGMSSSSVTFNLLIRTEAATSVDGSSGDDLLVSTASPQLFDGGAGYDKVTFSSNRASYTVVRTSSGYSVTEKTNTANEDSLSNVEEIQFGNEVLVLKYADLVQQLYVAYFGRPADSGALFNFSTTLKALGAPGDVQGLSSAYTTNAQVRELIDTFGSSTESNSLYSGDTVGFVTAVFQNVLNRAPQEAGLSFWQSAIDSGTLTKANAALSIMAGALQNTSTQGQVDGALISNRIIAASNFTLAIDTADEVTAYSGKQAAATARQMLGGVTGATDLVAFRATSDSTLSALMSTQNAATSFNEEYGTTIEVVGVTAENGSVSLYA